MDNSFENDKVILRNFENNDANNMHNLLANNNTKSEINELATKDYILDGIFEGRFVFKKSSIINYDGISKYQDIFYTVEEPEDKVQFFDNHLIVMFQDANGTQSFNSYDRYFSDNVELGLRKNIGDQGNYILRIADSNWLAGSFYVNTFSNSKYEENIQSLIKKIQKQYNIIDSNVILYGFSRGGTGALYHAALGNFKAVSVEPLIDIAQLYHNFWDKGEDRLLLEGQLNLDLSTYILKVLENYNRPKEDLIVLTSEYSPAFENSISILQSSEKIVKKNILANFEKLRITDLTITHGAFIGRTKKIAHSEIVQLLHKDIISTSYDAPDFYFKDWIALPDSFQFPENVNYKWMSHYFRAKKDNSESKISGFDFMGFQIIKNCIMPGDVLEIETIGSYRGNLFFYNFTKPFTFDWNEMISFVDKELVEIELISVNPVTNIHAYQIINKSEKSFYFIGFDTDDLALRRVGVTL